MSKKAPLGRLRHITKGRTIRPLRTAASASSDDAGAEQASAEDPHRTISAKLTKD